MSQRSAADGLAARAADDDAGAAPVEEEHRLLPAGERGVERRPQGAGEDRAVAGDQLLAQVDDLDGRERDRGRDGLAARGTAHALRQVEQGVAAGAGARGVADEVGRRRAEQRHGAGQFAVALDDLADVVAGRRLDLLVRPLVLFIDDDQGGVGGGGEEGGAGADDDVDLAVADAPAVLLEFAGAEAGVQHRDAPGHAGPEAVDRLWREGDLGHEHEGHAARVADALGGGQVDLGLAAAGDAAQQQQARIGRGVGRTAGVVKGDGDGGVGAGLIGGEDGDGGAGRRRGRGPRGRATAQQAALDEGVDVGGGGAGFGAASRSGRGPSSSAPIRPRRGARRRCAAATGWPRRRRPGRRGSAGRGGRRRRPGRRPRRGRRARRRPASG